MVKRRMAMACGTLACISIVSSAAVHQILFETVNSTTDKPAMPSVIIREPLTLQAWEEDPNFPPLGVSPDPNRPISYALLSVTFENTTLNRIDVKIKSVEIRSSQNGELINSLLESTLTLMPLEISAQQYRLFSRQSYGKHRSLVGSLGYEIDGREQSLTSPVVQLR